jgi:CheY-like chemotaxis protein
LSGARRRALIIEDNPKIRTLLRELLERCGYETQSASDGTEGLHLFEPGRDELIITDLSMPGATGWEVAETLRRRDPGLAVILATGSLGDFDTARRRALRVVVLPKPFTFAELRAAVDGARTLAAIGPAETSTSSRAP